MQLNILEIAQGLIDQLLEEEEKNRHRAEGVTMLFRRIQEAHAAVTQDTIEVVQDSTNVEG
tara:strand:+ start:51 stop:233 length:183 start_codon:yes stop_codon:yes gene_type:complete